MLGTNSRTLSYERAAPNPFRMRQNGHPVAGTLIARILVVPLCQGYRRWPHEHRVKADHRAGGITQRAIDAHAVLLVLLQLFRSLQEFALA